MNNPKILQVFSVEIGGSQTLDQIIHTLSVPVTQNITLRNFILDHSERKKKVKIALVDPGRDFNYHEGLSILKKNNIKPPTPEHTIRFVEQYGRKTTSKRRPTILFLNRLLRYIDRGTPLLDTNEIFCLCRHPKNRALGLTETDDFDASCVLAGVCSS